MVIVQAIGAAASFVDERRSKNGDSEDRTRLIRLSETHLLPKWVPTQAQRIGKKPFKTCRMKTHYLTRR